MQFDIVANDKATGTMQRAEKSMGTFSQNVVGKFTMMAAKAAVAYAAVTRLYNFISQSGDVADAAARLGLSVETFGRLKFAAEDYGASIENVAMALKDVNKLLDQAATKSGPDRQVLEALGFSQQEIADRAIKAEDVFKRVAEAIREARSEEEKFAIASRIVGDRVAQSMVPILADYDKFIEKSKGIRVMTDENAKAMDDASSRFKARTESLLADFQNFMGRMVRRVDPTMGVEAPAPVRTQEQIDEARRKRDALLAAAAKPEAPRESQMAVTSLQQIGGGVARGASPLETYAERTAIATETIAATATETPPAPTGSTDVTKPAEAPAAPSSRKTYRLGPFRMDITPKAKS
jgi:hypothetical protein